MLGIVVVVYKSFDDTVAFVTQQLPRMGCAWKAVVVDLASSPESTSRLAAACGADLAGEEGARSSAVTCLSTPLNLGYAKGNNLGARYLLDRFPEIDAILFSNDDIEVVSPQVAEHLMEVLADRHDVAVVGPKVVDPDGSEQVPFARPIPAGTAIWRHLTFVFERDGHRWEDAYRIPRGASENRDCYWLSGCFMMVRASDFLAVGGFDEATFLYHEEKILSERMTAIGRRTVYAPGVVVRHCCGRTTGKYLGSPELTRADVASNLHDYRTYRRLRGVPLLALRLCGAGRVMLVRLAVARSQARKRLATAWAAVRNRS